MMPVDLDVIELGRVLPGAVLLGDDETGVNETFVGPIETFTGKSRAFIKVLEPDQLVSELLCTALGRSLGYPIPRGFLLAVHKSHLPDSKVLASRDADIDFAFGSEAMPFPTLMRRVYLNVFNAHKFLSTPNRPELDDLAIFDDLVANIDRYSGNLLVDEKDKTQWIDHSHCFSGPGWTPSILKSDLQYRNQVAEIRFKRWMLLQNENY